MSEQKEVVETTSVSGLKHPFHRPLRYGFWCTQTACRHGYTKWLDVKGHIVNVTHSSLSQCDVRPPQLTSVGILSCPILFTLSDSEAESRKMVYNTIAQGATVFSDALRRSQVILDLLHTLELLQSPEIQKFVDSKFVGIMSRAVVADIGRVKRNPFLP
jgi:hypothetical protein